MLRTLAVLVAVCAVLFIPSCGGSPEEGPVVVLAAASLSDALTEVIALYQKAHPGVPVECSFTGSGEAASQILAGAPADVFISADTRPMDRLELDGKLLAGSRRDLLRNRLVVVAPSDSSAAIGSASDLAAPACARIAIGGPAVPAGEYARQWLSERDLLQTLEPRMIPFANVRAVLAAVQAGHADLGFVYITDASSGSGVRVAYDIPDREQPNIVYPSAIMAGTTRPQKAEQFLKYVYSPWGLRVFRRHGFIMPGETPTP